MSSQTEDWSAVLDRLIAGDAAAYLRFSRLVTGCLVQLRAYDFQDEWDDLRQEVLGAVVAARRAGRLQEPAAYVAYVRAVTRNHVFDRIRRAQRRHENETLPWEAVVEPERDDAVDPVLRSDLEAALARLSDEERALVVGVYVEGHSHPEMARISGVPLGTLKRRLRDGLSRLRSQLGATGRTGQRPGARTPAGSHAAGAAAAPPAANPLGAESGDPIPPRKETPST